MRLLVVVFSLVLISCVFPEVCAVRVQAQVKTPELRQKHLRYRSLDIERQSQRRRAGGGSMEPKDGIR